MPAVMQMALLGAASVLEDITITDDGDFDNNAVSESTVTFASLASTGPHTLIAMHTVTGPIDVSLTSATWGGDPVAVLTDSGASRTTYKIWWLYIAGAQSGDLVLEFSNAVFCYITVLSLDNLASGTPVDTDIDSQNSVSSITLDNLASPGAGGIRLGLVWHNNSAGGTTWTNATEVADLDLGSIHYSVAYDLGDDAGTITASFTSNNAMISGISLR